MADKGLINRSTVQAFADWIREQTGRTEKLLPSEMVALLDTIGGGKMETGELTFNGRNATAQTVAHNLGEVPDFAMIIRTTDSAAQGSLNYAFMITAPIQTFAIQAYNSSMVVHPKNNRMTMSATNVVFAGALSASSTTLLDFAGTYRYFIVKL